MDIIREITPLTQSDCFTLISRHKSEFDFPLHNHDEMELNLVLGAAGAKRIVGDHDSLISDHELVLIGSNLSHGWFTHHCTNTDFHEITIQFHKDLLEDGFLKRKQLTAIRKMFDDAKHGVSFAPETINKITSRLHALAEQTGFDALLQLFSILNELAGSSDRTMLSQSSYDAELLNYNSRRIEKVFEFMNANFRKQITLTDVSRIANMPEASFSRFIKQRTGYTFVDSLTEIRLGHVVRMLIDTTLSVAEIATLCGFNNMANFNRTFKGKTGFTPKEFKADYNGNMIFV